MPGTENSTAVILFKVRVPVLSEQIADTEPRVSTEGSSLTMAFMAARALVPMEYMVVTTAGKPVGIAEIARAIPDMKITSNS